MRLLLIESDDRLAAAQFPVLQRHGIAVTRASTGRRALQLLRPNPEAFSVIVLDLALPDTDGMTLCCDIRHRATDTPILLSSVRSHLGTRTLALRNGANDYLLKPYELQELVARVDVLLRGTTTPSATASGAGRGGQRP